MLIGLCQRFGQLPSAVLAEDAELLRLVAIEARGRREEQQSEPGDLDGLT